MRRPLEKPAKILPSDNPKTGKTVVIQNMIGGQPASQTLQQVTNRYAIYSEGVN